MKFSVINKKNKIYEKIYDIIEEAELNMNNPNHVENVKDLLKNYINNNCSEIYYSDNYENKDLFYEDLFLKFTENDEEYNQGNTIIIFANEKYMYEMIYLEYSINEHEKTDNDINQLASIINIELLPIFSNCAVIKTSFDNEYKLCNMTKNDIFDILFYNFYHEGLLIDTNNNMQNILFSGESPSNFIGNKFKMDNPINLFGFTFVCYVEDGNEVNQIVSNLFGKEYKGRVYITLLCINTNKKFWNLTKQTINDIIEINKNLEKVNLLEKELDNNKFTNPFFLLKKYI